MDDELTRLTREAESNPADEEAARRLEAALVRAGRTDEAKDRYRFKLQCPKDFKWTDLPVGDPWRPSARHCGACNRAVLFVKNEKQMERAIRNGDCVACVPKVIGLTLDGLVANEELHSARGPGDPCVIVGTDTEMRNAHAVVRGQPGRPFDFEPDPRPGFFGRLWKRLRG